MPKPIMDLWVTSSSDEEEDEEEVIPPPKKTKKPASEPPKSITKTTKVKPSKRVTRRNDIEDEDEDEDDFVVDARYAKKQSYNDHVLIERESNNRHRTNENRVGRESNRDSRDSRDHRASSERDYGRPSANKTSKTSITKISPLTDNQKSAATDDSVESSPTRKSSSRSFEEKTRVNDDEGMCSWINVKCILFFIFLLSATTLGFTAYLFYGRITDEMKANALKVSATVATTTTTTSTTAIIEAEESGG